MRYVHQITARRAVFFALLLFVAALAACGGGDTTAGPDNTQRPPGLIEIVSGAGQQVPAGEAVPVSPLLRVKNDRGDPLPGATLTLVPEGGRGTLDATSVVTDAKGEASLPRWVAPLLAGEFAVSVTATAPGSSTTVNARVTAVVSSTQATVATQTIGAAGGVLTVTSASSPLNGLTITVPAGAVTSSTPFTVATRGTPAPPADLTFVAPLIEINAAGLGTDSLIRIRIPASTGGSGILRVFVVGSAGELIPVPTHASDQTSITVIVRRFTTPVDAGGAYRLQSSASAALPDWLTLGVLRWVVPTSGAYGVGFAIGRDNLEFINHGSWWEDGGYCAGWSMMAGAWFRRKTGGAVLTARAQFPAFLTKAETQNWGLADQLNPAIRLATDLQVSYDGLLAGQYAADGQIDLRVWENILAQLKFSTQPVFLEVWNANYSGGHAVLVYHVDVTAGKVFVADPNFPDSPLGDQRFLQWLPNSQVFDAFGGAPVAGGGGVNYVNFLDASYLFVERAAEIGARVNQFLSSGLVGSYPPTSGLVKLKSGQNVTTLGSVVSIAAESRDGFLDYVPTLGSGRVDWVNVHADGSVATGGNAVGNILDNVVIPLVSGVNKIGVVLQKTTTAPNTSWYDTKHLLVTKRPPALLFFPQPVNGRVNTALPTFVVRLVDEDGNTVGETRSIELTLAGPSGATLTGGTATTISGIATFDNVVVNREGQGYTLIATSSGLAPVTSTLFDVTLGPGTFAGRVYDAVTTNPIAGVGITIRTIAGAQVATTTTSATGSWGSIELPAGNYTIRVGKLGYDSVFVVSQALTPPMTVVEAIPMVLNASAGGISGQLKDASTGLVIAGAATVEIRAGMNATAGAVVAAVQTANGTYAFAAIPAGVYTVVAIAAGYANGARTGVVVGAGTTRGNQHVMLSTLGGAARVVLSWNVIDLDGHMTGPIPGSANRFWISYLFRSSCALSPFVCLENDNFDGSGPESIALSQITAGVYKYYVYDFSNAFAQMSEGLSQSGARVDFYVGGSIQGSFHVPQGVGNKWEVFQWDGQTVTTVNRLYNAIGIPQPASANATQSSMIDQALWELQRRTRKPPP